MPGAHLSSGADGGFEPVRGADGPLFWREREAYATFYAPGCLCVVDRRAAGPFAAALSRPGAEPGSWAEALRQRAAEALAAAERLASEPFRPECLTLYLHNECNLACGYCYADPAAVPGARLDPASVAAAADLVAANCREKGLPLRVGFHGGGEPTLYRNQVEELLSLVRGAAARHGVESFLYVATNGVMSQEKAAWLARNFDMVGLSCDGPAVIHDAQRPARDGRGTLAAVERTAATLRRAGTLYQVRVTVTAEGLARQAEAADYICRVLAPEAIRLEPAYLGGRSRAAAAPGAGRAGDFVAGFLAARAVAAAYGLPLTISGSRLAEVHGPYCHPYRQVLNLVPGERGAVATVCFKAGTEALARAQGMAIGHLDRAAGDFVLDLARIAALRRQLAARPARCQACFNRFHCTGDCPDACPLAGEPGAAAGFRCQMQRGLAEAVLAETAGRLWAQVVAGDAQAPHGTRLF